jgi:subtilisin family serine protease
MPLPNFEESTRNTIDRDGEPAARVFHRQGNPINHDNQILIIFGPRMEPGVWRIVFGPRTQGAFTVQGWIAPDSVRSFFPELDLPRDNAYTIGSISCGHSSIAVGGYHSLDGQSLLDATAEGPTRDNRKKPEVSAPGATEPNKGIKAAFAGTRISAPLAEGGTSSAAPHVTGLIALLMQSAGRPLTTGEIRDLVTDYARLNPPAGKFSWHPRYGVGRVDASATIAITIVEGNGGAVK